MSEQDWQVTVLGELGIPLSGLVTPDSAGRPRPRRAAVSAPAGPSAPAVAAEPMAQPPAEPFAPAEPSVPPEPPLTAAQPPEPPLTPAQPPEPLPEPPAPPPADRPAADERDTPFPAGSGDRAGRQDGDRAGDQAGDRAGDQIGPPSHRQPPPSSPPATAPPATGTPPQPLPPDAPSAPEISQPPVARDPFAAPSGDAASPAANASWSPAAPPEQDRAGQWDREAAQPSWEQASQEQWDQASYVSWERRAPEPAAPEDPAFPAQQAPPASDRSAADAWQQASAPPDRSGAEAWRREAEAAPGAPTGPSPVPGAQPGTERPWQPAGGGSPAARELVRRSAHGDPLMRRMSRGVRRAVGVSAANDVRQAADVAAVLGRPVPSCRQIAVTSIRGGAGKTTVAGLTATAIAQYRQDRVLAIDADSGLGSLPLRMGVGPQRSLHDLMSAQPQTFEAASRYLAQTADGLWVLSGTAGGRIQGELDLATFRAAAGAMSRYFAATVIDCGAGLLPELQRGILADAHAQVMVTPGTVDGALSAQGALEWQARNGYEYLLGRTVVAFVTHTPHVDADLGRAGRMLSEGGLPVVHIPYDRHLATGTAVESARIGQETRAAMIRIAVEVFARSVTV